MDDNRYNQLDSIVKAILSEFLKKKKFHHRIFVVSDNLEARLYVAGKMLERFEEDGKDIFIVDKEKLPEDFVMGRDYAVGLDWYLADRRRRAFDLVS